MPRRRKKDTRPSMLFAQYTPHEIETRLTVTSFQPGQNPELANFIAEHAIPYKAEDDAYKVPAFARDLVVNKAASPKAIYDMHAYWSKKHWEAIREYIKHYLPQDIIPYGSGLVLDGMCGSGMTGVAALMLHRKVITIDVSPAAAFIAHHYTHPVSTIALERAFHHLFDTEYDLETQRRLAEATGKRLKTLREELRWLYETKCDRCGGQAILEYVVYSQQFRCPRCAQIIALFDCPEVPVEYRSYPSSSDSSEKQNVKRKQVCLYCYREHGHKGYPEFVISTRTERLGYIPVKVSYICEAGCRPKRDYRTHDDKSEKKRRYFLVDKNKIENIEHIVERFGTPHEYPKRRMMDTPPEQEVWGVEWRPGRNFQTIAELYTPRNLWGLAALNAARLASSNDSTVVSFLGLLVTGIAHLVSKMNRNRSSGGGTNSGTYYIPPIFRETLVSSVLERKFDDLVSAIDELTVQSRRCLVSNQTSTNLSQIPDCVIDYIFTDPPYIDKVQYGELNFLWEAWLGFSSHWLKDEIIVNPVRGKTLEDWESGMRATLAECYRVLKPGRWLSLCYHHPDPAIWRLVQDMLQDVGFEIHTVTELIPLQKSSNQITAEKVVKSDMVLNCRKPRPGEKGTNGPDAPEMGRITERVRDILIESLAARPGQTSDRLWSLTVKRLLSRGQMAEHRFADILTEVADRVEGDRWYLKEQYETAGAHDQANEEAAGATLDRFTRLRMIGVPADWAATVALEKPDLARLGAEGKLNEVAIEDYIRSRQGNGSSKPFKLSGNLRGLEFYDLLWFYMTRYMRGKKAGELPRRNLADFLGDYLMRFRSSDQWLYRPPDTKEAADLAADRRSGLGHRIRAFVSAIQQRDHAYLEGHRPDPRTLIDWLRHCAQFGLYEEGVILFEGSGVTVQHLERIPYNPAEEETGYDAARGYADICRRRLPRQLRATDRDDNEDEEVEEMNDNE